MIFARSKHSGRRALALLACAALTSCSSVTGEREIPPEGTLPGDLVEADEVLRAGEPVTLRLELR